MKTLTPLARDTDPITSHEAADKMVKSGELSAQEELVYDEIKGYVTRQRALNYPDDFTTKDIARRMSNLAYPYYYYYCYDICRKRFSGLHNKGKIERLNTKGELYKQGDELMRRDGCAVWRLL